MTFRRIKPCSPPRLPAPSLLAPVRYDRAKPRASFPGWVDAIDGDRVYVVGHEEGKRASPRLSFVLDMRNVRPTERAHLREGAYVVLDVRLGNKVSPRLRFPLRLARVGRWTQAELDEAKERGRQLFEGLNAVVHQSVPG